MYVDQTKTDRKNVYRREDCQRREGRRTPSAGSFVAAAAA